MPPTVSAPFAIQTDSTGGVWFTEKIGKKLIMFNPDTKNFAIYNLPSTWEGLGPSRLALGPHDEVWFTVRRSAEMDVGTNLLGRFLRVKNRFDRFELPKGVQPEALTVDHQGTVWFLNPDGNELGRLSADGSHLERDALPTANGNPREITVTKQGIVWFSLANINKIGRFDPIGKQFSEFDIPSPFANPGSLSTDLQGNVWFVELTGNRIARLSQESMRIDEVEIPTTAGLPIDLAVDEQGRVWFLEYRGNKVGLFDPTLATFQEFDIPTFNTQPGDMSLDQKRARLWFSETGTETSQLGLLNTTLALTNPPQPKTTDPNQVHQDAHNHGLPATASEPPFSLQSGLMLLLVIGLIGAIARWAYLRMNHHKVQS